METLYGNDAIQELMKLLAKNDRQNQAEDLSLLSWYMDGLEQQYNAALQELQEVKTQLAEVTEAQPERKNILQSMVETLENRMQDIRETMDSVWETVCTWAQNVLEEVKERGVLALDKIASVTGIKEKLEDIQVNLQESAADVKDTVSNLENMGRELREAGNHVRNAGRAAVGKQAHRIDTEKEGLFQKAVLAPVRGMEGLLSRMNNSALSAIGAAERLEHLSEAVREVRAVDKKPSIRQALAQKKAEAAQAAPASDRDHKRREAAL